MLSLRRSYMLLLVAFLFSMSSLMLSGCTISSGPKAFDKPDLEGIRPAPDATQKLTKAFRTTSEEGNKFYFSGWSGTKIQKRSNGYYVTGSYDKAKGYTLDARIFGQPFRFYRWGEDVYISEAEKWRKIKQPSEKPLEPFADFTKLEFLAPKAVLDHDEVILAKDCNQYVITLNYKEALQAAQNMGLNLSETDGDPAKLYFEKMKMVIRIWVGKDDSFIYKFMTQTTMPIPNAGAFYQEVSYKFWKYNNPGINIPPPEKLKQYLIE